MYLKEITASGFKSFADKISITLDGKTTCIVGPNGSGKSNVVDAVRWVLGEQSVKSLRGDGSMSDVIFSGSKSRNPLNVATVSLTFDNSDNYINMPYNEITVKRRVYRTGENEYFINNNKCRLKDVVELFLDSGIGKSSFNIISQGEVQKILSDSSYDRRMIIESAAGVLKYKKRKEESIRKLEKTHSNLERVNDIITELELQLEPLKEQSKKAEEYLSVKEKLQNIEVAVLATEITDINNLYQKTKEKIETLNIEIMNLGIKTNKDDTELLDAKNNLSKIELEIKSLNEDLLKLTKEEEKLNGEKNILKERSKYDASNNKIHENISYLNEEKLKLENSIYLTKKDLDDFYKELEQAKSLLNKDMLSLENIKNEYSRLYSELNNKNIELTDIKHKISITTDYINNGGGFNNSVKSVLNNPRLRGIHQTLGNLIDTEEKYVKAVDIALSASKQFIVVENEESAKQAINYLKENRLGRATFFPLNIIKPRGIDLDTMNILRGDSGFISVLSDKVEYDKIYYNIVSNQLGNIILVDNIDSANKISKRINQRYKIVTLDGDVVHVGGSMSGGSIASNKSIFKEKHELDLLNAKQLELEEIITSINTNLKELQLKRANVEQQTTNNQVRVFKLEEQYNVKNNLSNTLNQNLEEVLKELKSLENVTNSSLSKEEERIVKMFYETSRKKEEVIRNIKNYEKQKDNLNNVIDNIEASNKLNNSTLYSYEKELKTLEINISKMDIKLDNYLKILSEEYEMTYEKAKDNYELEMDLEEAKEEVTYTKTKLKI